MSDFGGGSGRLEDEYAALKLYVDKLKEDLAAAELRIHEMDTRFAIAFEALQDIADWGEYRSGGIADTAIEKLRD